MNRKKTKEYRSWCHMKHRCNCRTCHAYDQYGGRGIKVCKRWLKFENFLKDMGPCPDGMTIDRKDNDGDYCPSNCRWATRKSQANNRSSNHLLTVNGVTKNISQWTSATRLGRNAISNRLKTGWSISGACTVPIGGAKC